MRSFKFFIGKNYEFSHYCCQDNAEWIVKTLIDNHEMETTIFPKEYPHLHGTWRVLYITHTERGYHSVVCWVRNNPGYIIERFIVNIDYD